MARGGWGELLTSDPFFFLKLKKIPENSQLRE